MADDRALRLKAGHRFAKALGNPLVREEFKRSGYQSGDDVIVVLESDLVEDVYARIRQQAPPAVVAIYWPADDRITFTSFTPGDPPSEGSGSQTVGGTSTIGMVYRLAENQRTSITLSLRWKTESLSAHRFELV